MITIHKYALKIEEDQIVELPKGAEILDIQIQNGLPQIWALINATAPMEKRRFIVHGTGHIITKNLWNRHIATFQLHGGAVVFHAFEIPLEGG